MACKHDWHFIAEDTLRCTRCGAQTGGIDWSRFARVEDTWRDKYLRLNDLMQARETQPNKPCCQEARQAELQARETQPNKPCCQEARQAELQACCDLLEGMHVASTDTHNYYLHAANELRRFRSKP